MLESALILLGFLSMPAEAKVSLGTSVYNGTATVAVTVRQNLYQVAEQRLQKMAEKWQLTLLRRAMISKGAKQSAGHNISPYDGLVKKYANQYELDWLLVVAQMYQESRFDPTARSFAGAKGLMQVMPRTARQVGITDLYNPESSIHAGVRYLAWLKQRYRLLPADERKWFVLAAYNAGIGHVSDARRLAKRMGLRSDKWFGHVEKAMLLLAKPKYHRQSRYGYVRGHEPVKYVRAIRNYHKQYNQQVALRS